VKTSLLTELRKHAAYSEVLREASVHKTAGLDRAIWSGIKAVGKPILGWGMKNPGKAFTLGAGAAQVGAAYKASKPQFDQNVQRAQLGIGHDGLPLRG
jgi:hypothetical protein